ncbi:MAG: UDP-N-acetylglucosamine 2-epimerase (hydrolyzing) [Lachnospiraceae bacterium]|nr:UDP-N-acetylglucosamine 2-epimerase (hydrolyzing) [Lachnospiraceae bacterium]
MKRICVITAARAEYGLLYPVLKEIEKCKELELQLVVSGTHLKAEYGYTKNEIINDGFLEFDEIDIIDADGENADVSETMSNAILRFAGYLTKKRPDIAIMLGDRYEMMAFAIALMNARVPIAHLNGGEVTGGLLDEMYRHCITKMSTFHFVNCEKHRKRVIQLGEPPQNVFNVGDTCVDNIRNTKLMSLEELEKDLGIEINPEKLIIVTFHPVTAENNSLEQLENMLEVIKHYDSYTYLFTKSNSDNEGIYINQRIEKFTAENADCFLVDSLGRVKYLSLLNVAVLVMGNSSSGIYEVPFFHIPTINIGNRQKDRIHGQTVIDCGSDVKEIDKAFQLSRNKDFMDQCKIEENIFGDGHTARKIISIIENVLQAEMSTEKSFYDVDFNI